MTDDSDNLQQRGDVTLSPADAAAVDKILDHPAEGPAADAVESGESAKREARVRGWLKVVGAAAVPSAPADLADRTLAIIERERMKLQPAGAAAEKDLFSAPIRRRWSRRVAEIGAMAIAAMLLLAVVLMGVGQSRQSKARIACDENLQKWSTAFATYSASYSGELPSLAMPTDRNWLKTDQEETAQSNSANLSPMISANLVSFTNLYCAGAPPSGALTSTRYNLGPIGYSYTYLYGPVRPKWDGNHATIILADRNPMFLPGAVTSAATENSPNHGGHGNYVLRGDGAVTWETSPNAGPHGDNIWTVNKGAQLVTTYVGTESPASAGDAFVCP